MIDTAHKAGQAVFAAAKHVLRYIEHHTRPAHPRPAPRARAAESIEAQGAEHAPTSAAEL